MSWPYTQGVFFIFSTPHKYHQLFRNKSVLMRDLYRWLDDLPAASGHRIICAADYMGRQRRFLEAWRDRLYRERPVPEGWHEAYANGEIDIDAYGPLE